MKTSPVMSELDSVSVVVLCVCVCFFLDIYVSLSKRHILPKQAKWNGCVISDKLAYCGSAAF